VRRHLAHQVRVGTGWQAGVVVALGIVFRPEQPPEALVPTARAAEAAGLEQLWVWEDCFREGGISAAAVALAATERLAVGIGVLPVPLRNVALTAMELATLDRVFPGRLVAGIGHGIQGWMAQVGARPSSPLTLLREYTEALGALLAGEAVTTDGEYVRLDGVQLAWPPSGPVRLHLAGEGPRTLELVGAIADGLVVPGGYDPSRLREVVSRVSDAAERAGRERPPEVTVFLPCAFGADGERRVAAERAGVSADVPPGEVWGSPAEVAGGIPPYLDAGAHAVALVPLADDHDPVAFAASAGEVAGLVRAG
jgi:alkanesulfonate monooxygenase SsuD/methylene tetrahydromethanopterin reductase-like flavin-dependent oxidoreductase (luciferase family)